MKGLGILILVVVFFWVIWPVIARWLKRKAMQRAEDYLRASMGMPPRDKKSKKNKEQSYGESGSGNSYYQRQRRNPFGSDLYTQEPIIPKEYAEDVEFTETIEYSRTTVSEQKSETKTYHESQISDAEWTEIKKSGSK